MKAIWNFHYIRKCKYFDFILQFTLFLKTLFSKENIILKKSNIYDYNNNNKKKKKLKFNFF